MKNEEAARIKQIFCSVLGVSESDVNDYTSYNSFEAWDSLKHLEFITKLEEEFAIDIEMDDVIAMESFKQIKKIMEKYLDKTKP